MKTKEIGAKVGLNEKKHMVALRADEGGLVMHQIKYLDDEIRPMKK